MEAASEDIRGQIPLPRFFTTEHTETPFGRHGRRPGKRGASHVLATFPPHILGYGGFHIGTFRSEIPYYSKEVERVYINQLFDYVMRFIYDFIHSGGKKSYA